MGIAIWYLVGGLVFGAFLDRQGPLFPALNEVLRDDALMLAVLLFGNAVRSHRALMVETTARMHRVEEDRKRDAQELEAARVIQQQFLPGELPTMTGWRISAHYQPARAVGGDFYDLRELPDGRVAFVIGDATDKGIPAALVMATTHTILRGEGPSLQSPSAVLERANDRLYPEIPARMFVTCLYALLDPSTGRLTYANAGHNLPYAKTAEGAREMRATGMPLYAAKICVACHANGTQTEADGNRTRGRPRSGGRLRWHRAPGGPRRVWPALCTCGVGYRRQRFKAVTGALAEADGLGASRTSPSLPSQEIRSLAMGDGPPKGLEA